MQEASEVIMDVTMDLGSIVFYTSEYIRIYLKFA